jgi:hypothetical protein
MFSNSVLVQQIEDVMNGTEKSGLFETVKQRYSSLGGTMLTTEAPEDLS